MPRSPIEMMIDDVCSFDPSRVVTLRCPTCGREKRVGRDESDPVSAAVVIFDCPECRTPESANPEYICES